MKKGEEYTGVVVRTEFPNKGIVELEDRKIIVKNTVPGQKIRFRIAKLKQGRGEGTLLEIVEKAPEEVASACPHFGICGGCVYQSLPYEEQLKLKAGQVKKLMDPVAGEYEFLGIKGSPKPLEYRNKMEFSFGDEVKGGELMLGLHKRGSFYDIVDVSECTLVHPDFRKILVCVRDYCREQGLPYYHKMSHEGYLRHLLVRRAEKTGEILVNLVTTSQKELSLEPLKERLLSLPLEGKFAGILHSLNDGLADVVRSEKTEVLYGEEYFYEEILGLRFKISTYSFFQTNSLGAEVLYSQAREFIGEGNRKVVYDLYSGTGTIAQLMAPAAEKVIGVEIIEEAVEAARENAAGNGLENCEFIAGDVLKVLDSIEEKPEYIILDPPRDGIHPKALQKIIAYGVERMVYISCKPTSLARDLEALTAGGYRVEKVVCVDMFPQTASVETVCLLSKLNTKQHIEINLDMDELDLTDAEKKATYQEIKDYVLEHSGLKVSSLYIAQVKQKCGIIERENYNKPKSEDAKQPQCPPDKEKAIKEALKHFGMI
ncbi:MAG: 23S rRNA (uracil(1939)-C(5))-methyltransferase RlmD [Lachnospiraceae bacterium]|nr:23S rRNA (uracil(1939)-C(5))-methyltransferase RlmD [Lachnospiraceae bacterium]